VTEYDYRVIPQPHNAYCCDMQTQIMVDKMDYYSQQEREFLAKCEKEEEKERRRLLAKKCELRIGKPQKAKTQRVKEHFRRAR
jgi:hypothetical protein